MKKPAKLLIVLLTLGFMLSTAYETSAKPPSRRPTPRKQVVKEAPTPSLKPTTNSTSKRPSVGSSSNSRNSTRPQVGTSTKPQTGTNTRPQVGSSGTTSNSTKPTKTGIDSKANTAQQKAQSKSSFKKSTAPKKTYTSPTGKSIKIDPKSNSVSKIRSMNSNQYQNRTTRVEHHYTTTYGSRYSHYRTLPVVYVGGGYSSIFWHSTYDWSPHRQALWMYHNRSHISDELWRERMENAELRAELRAMEQQNIPVNNNYVDEEFAGNEDLMYSDEYVEAAYNPVAQPIIAQPAPKSNFLKYTMILVGLLVGGYLIYYVCLRPVNRYDN